MPIGRKDGRTSKANDSRQLPAPTFNLSQLQQSFSQRGLSMDDLVALSGYMIKEKRSNIFPITYLSPIIKEKCLIWSDAGGHTLGFAHCSSFQNRIHKFDAAHDVDPSMHTSFAASLRNVCPMNNKVKNAGANMDSSATVFDNAYYKLLLQGKSLFSSDQALLTSSRTKALVTKFARSEQEFYEAFVLSMIKMSSITGGQEIRLNCRVVN